METDEKLPQFPLIHGMLGENDIEMLPLQVVIVFHRMNASVPEGYNNMLCCNEFSCWMLLVLYQVNE